MPTTSFDKDSIKASIIGKLQRYNGRTIEEASNGQIYRALASTVRDQIMQKWMIAREERKTNNNKRLFYLSVESRTATRRFSTRTTRISSRMRSGTSSRR